MDDRIAQMTTLNAPNGVTRIGCTNAYATKLHTSPATIISIPVHHMNDFRYACPSPASIPSFVELINPFFLKTKLAPIKNPLPIAKDKPTTFVVGSDVALSDEDPSIAEGVYVGSAVTAAPSMAMMFPSAGGDVIAAITDYRVCIYNGEGDVTIRVIKRKEPDASTNG